VSKHIQELEREYGVTLFELFGNRIKITEAGMLLYRHCKSILKPYERMDFDMHTLQKKYCGELRIGASTTIAQYVLPEMIAKFRQANPQTFLLTIAITALGADTSFDKFKKSRIQAFRFGIDICLANRRRILSCGMARTNSVIFMRCLIRCNFYNP